MLHELHLKRLSSSWLLLWTFKAFGCLYDLEHSFMLHLKGLSSLWMFFACIISFDGPKNSFSHAEHFMAFLFDDFLFKFLSVHPST